MGPEGIPKGEHPKVPQLRGVENIRVVDTEKTSGAAKERPELERCMEEFREGDALVVWRLDRFGCSLKDLVAKMESLEEKDADFASLTEGIDTTTTQGKLTFHIFGALAEFERELTRERNMAGLNDARERGRVGGRPHGSDGNPGIV